MQQNLDTTEDGIRLKNSFVPMIVISFLALISSTAIIIHNTVLLVFNLEIGTLKGLYLPIALIVCIVYSIVSALTMHLYAKCRLLASLNEKGLLFESDILVGIVCVVVPIVNFIFTLVQMNYVI